MVFVAKSEWMERRPKKMEKVEFDMPTKKYLTKLRMNKNVQYNETQQSAAAAAAANSSSLRHNKQSAVIARVAKYIVSRSVPS